MDSSLSLVDPNLIYLVHSRSSTSAFCVNLKTSIIMVKYEKKKKEWREREKIEETEICPLLMENSLLRRLLC